MYRLKIATPDSCCA